MKQFGEMLDTVDGARTRNQQFGAADSIGALGADRAHILPARPRDLQEIEISPSGFGLHFPKVDADVYLPGLLSGEVGSRRWMAAKLGQRGGSARSATKAAAARANGKLGGRPRKAA